MDRKVFKAIENTVILEIILYLLLLTLCAFLTYNGKIAEQNIMCAILLSAVISGLIANVTMRKETKGEKGQLISQGLLTVLIASASTFLPEHKIITIINVTAAFLFGMFLAIIVRTGVGRKRKHKRKNKINIGHKR